MWEEKKLGDICEFGDGAHTKVKRLKNGVLYLSSKNFRNGNIKYENIDYISVEDYNRLFSFSTNSVRDLQVGDILIGIIGTIGNVYVYKKEDKFGISSSVAIIRPNALKVNSYYLYYVLSSRYFRKVLDIMKGGVAQGYINLPLLRNIPILLPSLMIQQKIADILSTYDELIENNNRRIELLEQAALQIYKEWFVRFRFPGYETADFVKGIPEGWEVKRLQETGHIETGKTPSTADAENYGGEILFIKTPDMHRQVFVVSTEEKLTKKGHNTQSKKYLPANSICVSCIGTGGVVAINAEPAHTNQQINSIMPSDESYVEWLYFTCKALKPTIEMFGATGATMTNLSKGKFERLKVIFPPKPLIEGFSKITSAMIQEIKTLQYKNQNLIKQRDLLLPRLMSGKIEV